METAYYFKIGHKFDVQMNVKMYHKRILIYILYT